MFLIFGVIAFLCEAASLGNPFPFSEQQYYLYGGGQILHHQVPYLDFWDRKPVGLFLLFAPIHLFGAYRFYALPTLAGCFMWGGALAIARIATLLSCRAFPTFLAGAVYLIGSNAYPDETGGQAEQFYIPLILFAVMLMIQAWPRITISLTDLIKTGLWVMLLFGTAFEIKSSCAWDGVFLFISLLFLAVSQTHACVKKRLLVFFSCGAFWGFIAALPTLLIMGYYALEGHLYDWFWANILNHHLRSKAIGHSTRFFDYSHYYLNYLKHASETCLFWGLPIFYFSYHFLQTGLKKLKAKVEIPALTPCFFLFVWGVVSLIASIQLRGGYAAVHYTMACMPASVILSALLWDKGHFGKLFLLLPLFYFSPKAIQTNLTSHQEERQLAQTITPLLQQQAGCLFQLSGSYLFYDLTPATAACRLNKFLLSGMLTSPEEQFALGINREDQFLNDLRKAPLYLVIDTCDERLACHSRFSPQAEVKDGLWATDAIPLQKRYDIQEIITRDYVPLYQGKNNKQGGNYVLYKLKPGLVPKVTPAHVKAEVSKPI